MTLVGHNYQSSDSLNRINSSSTNISNLNAVFSTQTLLSAIMLPVTTAISANDGRSTGTGDVHRCTSRQSVSGQPGGHWIRLPPAVASPRRTSRSVRSGNGCAAPEKTSTARTPKDQTSDAELNSSARTDSGGIHRSGTSPRRWSN